MAFDEQQGTDLQQSVEASGGVLDEQFGAALRRLRKARGWSLSYLGEVCGTSGANISKIERGRARKYTLPLLTSVASAFGMQLYEFFAAVESIDVAERAVEQDESSLLEAYRRMPESQRHVLLAVAMTLRPVE